MDLMRANEEEYGSNYNAHLFEQYKLYVEMADRVSSRRMLANSFFIGVHTALITAFSFLLKEKILEPNLVGFLPFVAVIVLCYVWWRVIFSYRQLNSGKFQVIHKIEQNLPIALYDGEWVALGEGNDNSKYLPLTHIETWVPVCFGVLYILLALSLGLSI